MRSTLTILLTACFWAVQVAAQVPTGPAVRAQARALFEANAFEEIDQLTQEYVASMARTANGSWLLFNIYSGIEQDFHGEVEDRAFWQDLDEKTSTYMAERPNSSTAIILRAEYYRRLAWAYRGNGFYKDVSREGRVRYRENMALAEAVLSHSGEQVKDNPHWYAEALLVRGGISARSSQFYDLLNEAMTRHPFYDPIYHDAAFYMDKRWSGDPELVDEFARIAADYTSAPYGAGMYAIIYINLGWSYYPRRNIFLYLDPDWALMKQGMIDILGNYPGEWNVQTFASIACMKGDADFTAELIARIKEPPNEAIWGKPVSFEICSLPNFGMITEEDLIRDIAMQWLFDTMLALGYEPLPVNR